MSGIIELREVLANMDNTDRKGRPEPFSIKFITADDAKQTGGDVMYFSTATLCFPNKSGTRAFNPAKQIAKINAQLKQGKAPEHVKNGTVNLLTEGNVITKCHIWLITEFNGKQVKWHIHG